MFARSLLVAAALVHVHHAAARLYTITNRCFIPITLFINGEQHETLNAYNGLVQKTYPENWSGFFYTNANGGNGSTGAGTTRAGFYGEEDDYYIVSDPNHFNTGVQIIPQYAPSGGYCSQAYCNSAGCRDAFTSPPTHISTGPDAPQIPLHSCPGTDFAYNIIFCPTGDFPPPSTSVTIHPNGNPNKCLDVRGAVYANGTPVQIYDCNGTGAQKWTLTDGNTKVALAGTGFCLDAGTTPGNNIGMKIWYCYNNLPAQAWYYTNDKRIAVTGKGQCLDLTNGVLTNGNQVQTYQCTNGNTNQIWTTTSF